MAQRASVWAGVREGESGVLVEAKWPSVDVKELKVPAANCSSAGAATRTQTVNGLGSH